MPPKRTAAPQMASKQLMPVLLKRAELQDTFVRSLPCKWNKLGKEPSIRLQRAFHRVANVLFNLPPMPHDPESYAKALKAEEERQDSAAREQKQIEAKARRDRLFKQRAKESAARTGFEAPKTEMESSFLNSLKRPENRIKVNVVALTPEAEEEQRWAKRQRELEDERAALGLEGGTKVFSSFADKDAPGVDEASGGVERDEDGYGLYALLDTNAETDAQREARFKEESAKARREAVEAAKLKKKERYVEPTVFRVAPKDGKQSAIVAKIKRKEGYKMNGKDSMGRNPLDVAASKKRGSIEAITGRKIASMTEFLTKDAGIIRHKESKGHAAPRGKAQAVQMAMKGVQKSMVKVEKGYDQNSAYGSSREGYEGGPAYMHGRMVKEQAEKLCMSGSKPKKDGSFLIWEMFPANAPPQLYGLSMVFQKRVTHHRLHFDKDEGPAGAWMVNGKMLAGPHSDLTTLIAAMKKSIGGWPQVLSNAVKLGKTEALPSVEPAGTTFVGAQYVRADTTRILTAAELEDQRAQARLDEQERLWEEQQARIEAEKADLGIEEGGVRARKEKEAKVFDAFANFMEQMQVDDAFGGIVDEDEGEPIDESKEDGEFEIPQMYQLLAQQWQ